MYRSTIFVSLLITAAAITVGCAATDDGISTRVKTNLSADQALKTAQIEVGVQKKIVTLSGTVDTPAVKEQAVAVARRTDGVTDVVDQMTVREQGSGVGAAPGPGFGREMMEKGMKMEGPAHSKDGKRD